MSDATPYRRGTRLQSNRTHNKKLFSDIARGALRCDGRGTPCTKGAHSNDTSKFTLQDVGHIIQDASFLAAPLPRGRRMCMGQRPVPNTHTAVVRVLAEGKTETYQRGFQRGSGFPEEAGGAQKWRAVWGTQAFVWPLTHPLPLGVGSPKQEPAANRWAFLKIGQQNSGLQRA